MNDREIYKKFLEDTKELEFELGYLAFLLSKLFTRFPPKMRMSQAFNIIYKMAHQTPGWRLAANHKHQKVLRREYA